jgi:hypothetical protein
MSTPLRLLLTELLDDTAVRSAFDADPEAFLAEHGWDGLDGADVHTALDALTHELPVDQAARLAPLVAEDAAFDGDGLSAAIAGLQAATAAVDDLAATNGAGADDGAIDVLTDDPAAGIDADSDRTPLGESERVSADAEEDDEAETDPSSGIDDLGFGDAPHTALAPEADVDAGSDDAEAGHDEATGDLTGGLASDQTTPAELIGDDPAAAFDENSSRDFYDPGEETSELDDAEEPDDGFPY